MVSPNRWTMKWEEQGGFRRLRPAAGPELGRAWQKRPYFIGRRQIDTVLP